MPTSLNSAVTPNPPLLPPFATAIEIAATQTKSACADWVITGIANPDLLSHISALFGLRATVIYIAFGVGLAIAAGYIIGMLHLEKWVEPFVWALQKSRQGSDCDRDQGIPSA